MKADLEELRVTVVCGGTSAEAEVSRASGRMVAAAATEAGAQVTVIDPDEIIDHVRGGHVDVVFPALHGPLGEDGRIQGLLDVLGVAYVGSGVLASACANDKITAKRLFRDAGLPVAKELVVEPHQISTLDAEAILDRLGGDVVIKPAREGSAVGVGFAVTTDELSEHLHRSAGRGPLLLEQRINGSEVTAGVLHTDADPIPLPLVGVELPDGAWYDYQHRYTPGLSNHVIPAGLSSELTEQVRQIAVRAHGVLGCRHLSRADFIVDPVTGPVLLEVNTMPGMTPTSLYPDAAAHAGHDFTALVTQLIDTVL